jgi:hypothetical protein
MTERYTCGHAHEAHPALSRYGHGDICSQCGTREALQGDFITLRETRNEKRDEFYTALESGASMNELEDILGDDDPFAII